MACVLCVVCCKYVCCNCSRVFELTDNLFFTCTTCTGIRYLYLGSWLPVPVLVSLLTTTCCYSALVLVLVPSSSSTIVVGIDGHAMGFWFLHFFETFHKRAIFLCPCRSRQFLWLYQGSISTPTMTHNFPRTYQVEKKGGGWGGVSLACLSVQ
jgi:hypothetical protein